MVQVVLSVFNCTAGMQPTLQCCAASPHVVSEASKENRNGMHRETERVP